MCLSYWQNQFRDIDPKTGNIDTISCKNYYKKTKAIIVVHFVGLPANMDAEKRIVVKTPISYRGLCCSIRSKI